MKKLFLSTAVVLGLGFFIGTNSVSASENDIEISTEIQGRYKIVTYNYESSDISNYEITDNNLIVTFSDETTLTIFEAEANFDVYNFKYVVEERYDLFTPKAGGAIGFPDTVGATVYGYGTSNYPPGSKYAEATRTRIYKERQYRATYNGNVPLSSIQSSTGGGKTYIYSGQIPYRSHVAI